MLWGQLGRSLGVEGLGRGIKPGKCAVDVWGG